MNRAAAAQWCERGIALLVLVILAFSAVATGAVRTLEFLVVQGLTLGVLLLWGLRLWLTEKPRLFWPPVSWVVLAFTGYAVARYLTADIEYVARQEMIRVLVYASLFFAIVNNLQRPETMTFIIRAIVFLAMAIAGYAIYQYMTGDNRVWHFINPYENRGSGTFINPNHLAGFLELILPVGLAYLLVGRGRHAVLAIAMGYALLVVAAGLAVSFSRGGWISTVVALTVLFVVLVFKPRYRWPAVAALSIVVLLGAVFFNQNLFSKYRLARIFDHGALNTELRSALWEPALEMWQENVWFGVGPAHYDYRFRQFRPAEVQARPERAHNDYVNTLADWGIVGAGLVGAAWLLAGIGAVRCWRGLGRGDDMGSGGSDRLALVLGTSCGLLAILVHSLTDFNLHVPANALLVVTWMAFLTVQLRYVSNRAWVNSVGWVRGAGSVGILISMVYLGWQLQVRGREYLWLQQAARAEPNSHEQLQALEQAFAIEPMNFENAYNIGDVYRTRSWWRQADYETEAEQAMQWFERSMQLNPYDPYGPLRMGMCLDWLGRTAESEPYYNRADELDPRGHYIAAHIGWHYLQIQDYPAAQAWFERSKRLQWKDNNMSTTYLEIIRNRMLDAATNPLALPLKLRGE
ncbi:MAG: O-antigen ligase family protein [Verrucomicrobia bacterium]|nr:O-antigen ligase family protein [Verrucomicrobiota bacterium]